jgi:putative SOS response-associated peptidase YedK
MCGRFLKLKRIKEYARKLGIPVDDLLDQLEREELERRRPPRYNVCPGTQVDVFRLSNGRAEVAPLWWGLLPSWAKDRSSARRPINARSETAAEKSMFRKLLGTRRCLIPADGYYEWKATPAGKAPYCVRMVDEEPFFFAGLWDSWAPRDGTEPVESFTMFTTRPNALMAQILDRMPVIVRPEDYALWLDPGMHDVASIARVFEPYPAADLVAYPVSRLVSSPQNDGPELIEPTGPRLAAASASYSSS